MSALLLVAASPESAAAGGQDDELLEVVERWPDDSVRVRYQVDEQGRRQGLLEEFREDGSVLMRVEFKEGERWGKFESFHPGGERWIVAQYKRGQKDGAWRQYREDGSKVEISQWKKGQLNGRFESYYADGERHIVADYRDGERHGKLRETREGGSWERSAQYEEGLLHGEVKISRDRKVLSKQRWLRGELLVLDGRRPFPVQRVALLQQLEETLAEPEVDAKSGPKANAGAAQQEAPVDALLPQRQTALRRLQAYRQLCRVPHAELVLWPAWFELVDAAGEVCNALGRLSHDPPRPEGMDEEKYRKGHRGASRSNLSMGSSLVSSVDAYMDDSDPSNIDRVGHRRWCLNPNMRRTAFGGHGRFTAMWSMDSSGAGAKGLDSVKYPPEGYVPVDFFGPRHAWSVATLRGGRMVADKAKIEVVALDENYLEDGEALELDYRGVAPTGYGTGTCLLFRPVGLEVSPGCRYRCRISLDGGRRWDYDYVVEFCEEVGGSRDAGF